MATQPPPEDPQTPHQQGAYALLSTPTLSITDEQALLIIADLRKRRFTSLSTGKPDKIAKPKAEKTAAQKTKEEKAAATAALLAGIDWNS